MASLKSRVLSGVFWVTATNALGQVITWLITLVVFRVLSPADYGVMGMAILVIHFLILFSEVGLGTAMIQKAGLDDDMVSDLSWTIFLINTFLCVGLFALAPAIAQYFRTPELAAVLRVLGFAFVVNGFGSGPMFMLSREMAFRKKARAELIGSVAGGFSTLVLAYLGFGVWSLVSGYLLRQTLSQILYWVYRPVTIRMKVSLANVTEFAQFCFHLTSGRVLWYVSASADTMIVGRILGTTQLGYYSLAFQLASVPIEKLFTIVSQIAFPWFSALQHDDREFRRHFLKLLNAVAFITFPMFLGLFAVADSAILVFLTSKWDPAVVPLKLLCLVSSLRMIASLNAPLVLAKGKPGYVMWNNLLNALVMPLAFYIGTSWGLTGVALAWLITYPVLALIVTGPVIRLIGLPFTQYLGAIAQPALGSVLMVGVVSLFQRLTVHQTPEWQLAISCATGFLAYFAYAILFNGAMLREIVGLLQRRAAVGSAASVTAEPVSAGAAQNP